MVNARSDSVARSLREALKSRRRRSGISEWSVTWSSVICRLEHSSWPAPEVGIDLIHRGQLLELPWPAWRRQSGGARVSNGRVSRQVAGTDRASAAVGRQSSPDGRTEWQIAAAATLPASGSVSGPSSSSTFTKRNLRPLVGLTKYRNSIYKDFLGDLRGTPVMCMLNHCPWWCKWVLNELIHSRQWFNTLIPRSQTVVVKVMYCGKTTAQAANAIAVSSVQIHPPWRQRLVLSSHSQGLCLVSTIPLPLFRCRFAVMPF